MGIGAKISVLRSEDARLFMRAPTAAATYGLETRRGFGYLDICFPPDAEAGSPEGRT